MGENIEPYQAKKMMLLKDAPQTIREYGGNGNTWMSGFGSHKNHTSSEEGHSREGYEQRQCSNPRASGRRVQKPGDHSSACRGKETPSTYGPRRAGWVKRKVARVTEGGTGGNSR